MFALSSWQSAGYITHHYIALQDTLQFAQYPVLIDIYSGVNAGTYCAGVGVRAVRNMSILVRLYSDRY